MCRYFKLLQDLLAPSKVKGKSQFQLLMQLLPDDHKARWLAGAALNSGEQAMLSGSSSTAMSRLNAFLDSELEQVLCFDSAIDAERFCAGKTALFIVIAGGRPYLLLPGKPHHPAALPGTDDGGGRARRQTPKPRDFLCG